MKRRGGADRHLTAAAAHGFTLIEVLVALVIVALGMSALLETLSASANNISALRDKTIAEWIAMNQIADARLALTVPPIGITSGDVHNCGNANWHWQQQVAAIDAVPGLLSITVSVQRTGNASAQDSSSHNSSSSGSSATGATAGGLGTSSLGATAGLGSSSAIIGIGCTNTSGPGSSLGASGNSIGAGASIGPSDSIGPSGGIGPGATTGTSTGNPANRAAAGSAGANGPNSGGSLTALPSAGGKGQNWLITLTGFRGNSLGAASGESPDWTGSTFAGESGANGIPNGSGGVTTAPPQAGVLTQ